MKDETPDEKLIFMLMTLLSVRIANDNNVLNMGDEDRSAWYESSRQMLMIGAKRLRIDPPTIQ